MWTELKVARLARSASTFSCRWFNISMLNVQFEDKQINKERKRCFLLWLCVAPLGIFFSFCGWVVLHKVSGGVKTLKRGRPKNIRVFSVHSDYGQWTSISATSGLTWDNKRLFFFLIVETISHWDTAKPLRGNMDVAMAINAEEMKLFNSNSNYPDLLKNEYFFIFRGKMLKKKWNNYWQQDFGTKKKTTDWLRKKIFNGNFKYIKATQSHKNDKWHTSVQKPNNPKLLGKSMVQLSVIGWFKSTFWKHLIDFRLFLPHTESLRYETSYCYW